MNLFQQESFPKLMLLNNSQIMYTFDILPEQLDHFPL
jgi:hypothetical protein